MSKTGESVNGKTTNRLLASLPDEDYQNPVGHSERTDLVYGTTLYKTGAVIRHVYFPETVFLRAALYLCSLPSMAIRRSKSASSAVKG